MVRLLDGVKVFELGIAIASPATGRLLAHHGAEVYKVESPTSPDIVRLIGSAWLRDDEELAPALPDLESVHLGDERRQEKRRS